MRTRPVTTPAIRFSAIFHPTPSQLKGNTLVTQKEAAYYTAWCHMDAGVSAVKVVQRGDGDYVVFTRKHARALREQLSGITHPQEKQTVIDGFLQRYKKVIDETLPYKSLTQCQSEVTLADILQQVSDGLARLAEHRREAED